MIQGVRVECRQTLVFGEREGYAMIGFQHDYGVVSKSRRHQFRKNSADHIIRANALNCSIEPFPHELPANQAQTQVQPTSSGW